jgi:hypothetical protein
MYCVDASLGNSALYITDTKRDNSADKNEDQDRDEKKKSEWTNWCGTPFITTDVSNILVLHFTPPPSRSDILAFCASSPSRWSSFFGTKSTLSLVLRRRWDPPSVRCLSDALHV